MKCLKFLIVVVVFLVIVVFADKDDDGGESDKVETVIGIDLGTSHSCVGVINNGHIEIVPDEEGNRITPSFVAFTAEGEHLVGETAKYQLASNPENTVFDSKRLIGRLWEDKSVQDDIKLFPFNVINQDGKPHIVVQAGTNKKIFTAEDISAMIIKKMKESAETYLGVKIQNAVIAVPAYFNDMQRQATKNASSIAGLNPLRYINEPAPVFNSIAAAIAYELDSFDADGEKNILVFDLDTSTFDISMITVDHGVYEVLSTNGKSHFGGVNFNERVMEYFINLYEKKNGKDFRHSNLAMQKLNQEVEKAITALYTEQTAHIMIKSLFEGQDFSELLTRTKFEELNLDLFQLTMDPIQKVLEDAELLREDVDDIVLVGGSTRILKVQQLIKEYFNGKEPMYGINPEEVVAIGAAMQAKILSTKNDNFCLCDFNALTIGIETVGGVMTKLIPRYTLIPLEKSHIFSTVFDNQSTVIIQVYEGERPMAKDNHMLGTFELTNIPPRPKILSQINVTLMIDVNGIIWASAEDMATGNKNNISIKHNENGLRGEDIENMINEAEIFAAKDMKIKEQLESRNELDSVPYHLKNKIDNKQTMGDTVSNDHKDISGEELKSNQEAENFQKDTKEVIVQHTDSSFHEDSDVLPNRKVIEKQDNVHDGDDL